MIVVAMQRAPAPHAKLFQGVVLSALPLAGPSNALSTPKYNPGMLVRSCEHGFAFGLFLKRSFVRLMKKRRERENGGWY